MKKDTFNAQARLKHDLIPMKYNTCNVVNLTTKKSQILYFKTFQMFSQNLKSKIVFFLVTLLKDNCKTLKIAEKLVFLLRRLWTYAGVKGMLEDKLIFIPFFV